MQTPDTSLASDTKASMSVLCDCKFCTVHHLFLLHHFSVTWLGLQGDLHILIVQEDHASAISHMCIYRVTHDSSGLPQFLAKT